MAKYFIEDTTLTAMADTIRSLTGSTAPLTPSEMTAGVQEAKEDVDSAMDALETLGVEVPEGSDVGDLAGLVGEVEVGGGGAELARSIVDGTITEYVDTGVLSIAEYAFYKRTSLVNVDIPKAQEVKANAFYQCTGTKNITCSNVRIIGGSAFSSCTGVFDVNFSIVTGIGSSAFYNCVGLPANVSLPLVTSISGSTFAKSSIQALSVPVATSVGSQAFFECKYLSTVDGSAMTTVGNSAFGYCRALESVSFPALTKTETAAFEECRSLTSVDFPLLATVGRQTFYGCTNIVDVNIPLMSKVDSSVFYHCSKLPKMDLPVAASIATQAFYKCSVLETVIIRKSNAICTLSNKNAFTSTPIASGTGYIYVPSALIDTYKSATNWSTYADQFRALEDYTVDGTITGELDESKI